MMFTGIISNRGKISSLKKENGGIELVVTSFDEDFFAETKLGDSVAVNGVCLTVTSFDRDSMTTFAQIETIEKTTIGLFKLGQEINLEHPLRLSDRLGGHLVQGHVDGVANVIAIKPESDGSTRVTIEAPPELMRFISLKGSVSIDGVSLTIASREKTNFDVALIPVTLEKTGFGKYGPGTKVNIEVDCLARYVDQLMNKE